MTDLLAALEHDDIYGMILRAQGIVKAKDGRWIHFDYIPGESDVRYGTPAPIGKICVIGSHINEESIANLFEGIKE